MKRLKLLAASVIASVVITPIALAKDIIRIDRLNAQERVVEIDVTPMGVVIDFGSPISSVVISHRSNIVYHGMDGTLCLESSRCRGGSPPTILFVRKIPKINFKDEEPMVGGYSLLYVDTESGMYRFQMKPVNQTPKYTKVEIQNSVTPTPFSRQVRGNR